jgi:SAM-dependent methyltransferase
MKKKLYNEHCWRHLVFYPLSGISLFRLNQDKFISDNAHYIRNEVIEIGAEQQYNYGSLFESIKYVPTNYSREKHFEFLDVCEINKPDHSVGNYLCISVLEHVPNLNKAVEEIHRTLISGGKLIVVIPFLYPVHDEKDFWRLAPDGYEYLFKDFNIIEYAHLGARFSACAEICQRPKGKFGSIRNIISKFLSWPLVICSAILDTMDDYPMGYGMVLEKKSKCAAYSGNIAIN